MLEKKGKEKDETEEEENVKLFKEGVTQKEGLIRQNGRNGEDL